MDPLSATGAVLGVVIPCITAIQKCSDYAAKYKIADQAIALIRTECSSVRIALLQIENVISSDPERAAEDRFEEYLLVEYQAVLGACSQTFAIFNAQLEQMGLDQLNSWNETDLASRLRFMWNESQIRSIQNSIRSLVAALTLLVTAFSSGTATKTYQILKSENARTVLQTVSNDNATLRESWTRSKAGGENQSTIGSVIGDEEFEFDDVVINSKAYRRVFHAQKKRLDGKDVSVIEEEEGPYTQESTGEDEKKDTNKSKAFFRFSRSLKLNLNSHEQSPADSLPGSKFRSRSDIFRKVWDNLKGEDTASQSADKTSSHEVFEQPPRPELKVKIGSDDIYYPHYFPSEAPPSPQSPRSLFSETPPSPQSPRPLFGDISNPPHRT